MSAVQNPSSRLRSIDALRGIAALGVVFYHAVEQGKNALPNNLLDYPIRALQFVSSFGYIGVFLFFVISGFCIHLQWAKARATGVEPDVRLVHSGNDACAGSTRRTSSRSRCFFSSPTPTARSTSPTSSFTTSS